jgi:hypothetical protein
MSGGHALGKRGPDSDLFPSLNSVRDGLTAVIEIGFQRPAGEPAIRPAEQYAMAGTLCQCPNFVRHMSEMSMPKTTEDRVNTAVRLRGSAIKFIALLLEFEEFQ